MKLFAIQCDVVWQQPQDNFRRLEWLLEEGGVTPGSLLVFPEMFSSGFTMDVGAATAGEPARTANWMRQIARRYQSAVIGGLASPTESPEWGHNGLLAFDPDGIELARYQKIHTITPSGESHHYRRGNETVVFPFGGHAIFPAICYDLRFPELFRVGIDRGADLLVVIANWPEQRHGHWELLLTARAIENQAWVVGVNRCGSDPGYNYRGGSVVIDPRGKVTARAGDREVILKADTDPAAAQEWRAEFPVLCDRREFS